MCTRWLTFRNTISGICISLMVRPTGWKMIAIILWPEFLKKRHFTDRIHVHLEGAIIQNTIITIFTIFSTIYQFCTSYSNVAWFNMIYNIYSKVKFLPIYALKIDLSCLKISKISQLGEGAQTPPHAERKNQYCGRTTFQHLAPPLRNIWFYTITVLFDRQITPDVYITISEVTW